MAQNPNNAFTNASIDGTSAVFDGTSATPCEVEASVSGGLLSAGTIVSETSLDNAVWDTTSHVYSFTYTEINAGTVKSYAEGFPFIRFKLNGKTTASGTPLVSCTMILGTLEGDALLKGDTGTAGSAGTHGDTGSAGTHGDTGSAGTHGDTGSAGTHGDTGSAGTHGDTGIGASGTHGDTGAQGAVTSGTAGSADTGVTGTMKVDGSYLYVAYGTNQWARIATDTGAF